MGSFLGGRVCPVEGGMGFCPACPDGVGGRGKGGMCTQRWNSRTNSWVEVSGHNLESSQT
jgi:hypothetical protein